MSHTPEFSLGRAILENIARAVEAERRCISIARGNKGLMPDDDDYVDDQVERSKLSYYVEKVFRQCAILAERLKLPAERARIEGIRMHLGDDKLNEIEIDPFDGCDGRYCPALARARQAFENLEPVIFQQDLPGVEVLRTILENTAKILAERKVVPKNERQIKDEVFAVLKYAFRDAVREVPIAQSMKTYKSDIGVRSLKVAIEYKFARSMQELRPELDGMYADMKGYGGHHDWQTFFAVFVVTGSFCTQKDVEYEFRAAKADGNWIPIVVRA